MQEFSATGTDTYTTSLLRYLQDGNLDVGSNFNKNFNSQVNTKALLLERLATALGCTASDRFQSPRVPSNDVIPFTLKPIVRYAGQWPRYLQSLGDHLSQPEASHHGGAQVTPLDSLQPASNPLFKNLSLLSQSRHKLDKADRLIAEANILLIAFMVFWHSTVSFCFLRQRACTLTTPCAAQHSCPS